MRLLLDTHAFIWWLNDNAALSRAAYGGLIDPSNVVYVSAASAWEIATKQRIGKLPRAGALADDVAAAIAREQFIPLPISLAHAELAGRLTGDHRDPFDRMLIAQAIAEKMTLISNERPFDAFGVSRLW